MRRLHQDLVRHPVAGIVLLSIALAFGCRSGHDVVVLFGNKGYLPGTAEFANRAGASGEAVGELSESVTDSERLYRDARLEGDDDDPRLGIESGALAYYIGHGWPGEFSAYEGARVYLDEVQFGDSHLRYLWMVSCQTMAHGPYSFYEPQAFDPAVKERSENVFRRWGGYYFHPSVLPTTPLGPKLRMACGGSTRLRTPTLKSIGDLWESLVTGTPPSDAFITSNSQDDRIPKKRPVPLCITRGGNLPESTPLYDATLSDEPNPRGRGRYLYIQYPVFVDSSMEDGLVKAAWSLAAPGTTPPSEPGSSFDALPPLQAPILEVAPLPVPAALARSFLSAGNQRQLGFRSLQLPLALAALRAEVPASLEQFDAYFQPCSGKLAFRGPQVPAKELPGLTGADEATVAGLDSKLQKAIALFSSLEAVPTSTERVDMYLDRAPPEVAAGGGSKHDIKRYLKSHALAMTFGVVAGKKLFPVLGAERALSLEVGSRGELISGSVAARQVTGCRGGSSCPEIRVSTRDTAQREAVRIASRSGVRYENPPGYRWGYLEALASCYQREMGIVHRFTFEPAEEEDALVLVVDIPGHEGVEEPLCYGFDRPVDAPGLPEGCNPGGR